MTNKLINVLSDLWNNYVDGHKSTVFKSSYVSCILYLIYKKLDKDGEISDIEKSFIIDYMKEGVMNDCQILDYEDLRTRHPDVMLPEASDF